MVKYEGLIKDLKQFVIADFCCKKGLLYHYDNKFENSVDWEVELVLEESKNIENFDNINCKHQIKNFSIMLKNSSIDLSNNYDLIDAYKSIKEKEFEIRTDNKLIALGVNDVVSKIEKNYMDKNENYIVYNQLPKFMLKIDENSFGTVREFWYKDNLSTIAINYCLGNDVICDEEKLVNYLQENLKIENLKKLKRYNISMEIDFEDDEEEYEYD